MHPDLMREIVNQRAAERQDQARKISLARALRKAMRQRSRAEVPGILLRPIPDYVDGTYRALRILRADERAGDRTGAARR